MNLPIKEIPNDDILYAFNFGMALRMNKGMTTTTVLPAEHGERDYLGMSRLGDPHCVLWHFLMGDPVEATDFGSQLGFDTGHVFEEYILDLLGVEKEYRQEEVSFRFDYTLRGEPRQLILGHKDGQAIFSGVPCGLEVKAQGASRFNRKHNEGPEEGHLMQAFACAAATKPEPIPNFAVIYVDREAKKASQKLLVFKYEITTDFPRDALAELVNERFLTAAEGVEYGECPSMPTHPAGTFGPKGWMCRPDSEYVKKGGQVVKLPGYCGYRAICPHAKNF